jgi:hypothetical protein
VCFVVRPTTADPNFSFSVFKDFPNQPSVVSVIDYQSFVDKTCQTGLRSDPQAPILCGQQGHDFGTGQLFPGLGAPSNEIHAVKFEESSRSSHPDVAVFRLRDREYPSPEISVFGSPRRVAVLRNMRFGSLSKT